MTGSKAAAAGSLAFPVLAAIDWRFAAAVALGIVSGWLCRAAVPYANRMPWAEIRRSLVLSAMISGGSLIVTLYLARLMQVDALGAAVVAWATAFGGLDSLVLARDYVWLPIRRALGTVPPKEGD